jgi:hypothetical protein
VLSELLRLQQSTLKRCWRLSFIFEAVSLEAYMLERRRVPRMRVFKGAKFVVGTSSIIDCTVRDLSNVGARAQLSNAIDLPGKVDMTFDGGRSLRPCRIVWRTFNETGVEFSR